MLLYLILSLLLGILLGAFFFGGLWWTVQKMTGGSRPYMLFATSFIVRTTVLLTVLYLLLAGGWQFMLTALAGFLIARILISYRLKPQL